MNGRALIHIDGAAKGNPGPAGIGVSARTEEGDSLFEHFRYIGETTNNVAEYTALIEGLQNALEHGVTKIRVASDSQLLVRQINGVYKIRKPHLQKLSKQVMELVKQFEQFEIFHIPRSQNTRADSLANQAIQEYGSR